MFPGGCERGVKKQSAPCGVFCSNHDGDFELETLRQAINKAAGK